jgi:hypothetical protein
MKDIGGAGGLDTTDEAELLSSVVPVPEDIKLVADKVKILEEQKVEKKLAQATAQKQTPGRSKLQAAPAPEPKIQAPPIKATKPVAQTPAQVTT